MDRRVPPSGRARAAVFEQAFYPYLNTVTCAGHATLGTGAWPKTHGIILNEWYRRDLGRVRSCTADATTTPVHVRRRAREARATAPAKLRVPTLAERLRRRWPESRSVSLSLKPRSAVMMAGTRRHRGDVGRRRRLADVHGVRQRPGRRGGACARPRSRSSANAAWCGSGCCRAPAYTGTDDRPGRASAHGLDQPLSRIRCSVPTTPKELIELWQTSPYADEQLGAMAAALVESFELGPARRRRLPRRELLGHRPGRPRLRPREPRGAGRPGPARPHARHAAVGARRLVGRDRYVLALSADHGVAHGAGSGAAAGAVGRPRAARPRSATR